MWEHNYQPIGGSIGLSAIVAVIPIVVLFAYGIAPFLLKFHR